MEWAPYQLDLVFRQWARSCIFAPITMTGCVTECCKEWAPYRLDLVFRLRARSSIFASTARTGSVTSNEHHIGSKQELINHHMTGALTATCWQKYWGRDVSGCDLASRAVKIIQWLTNMSTERYKYCSSAVSYYKNMDDHRERIEYTLDNRE